MGWADPAQPTGPDSAQWCWADLGPKNYHSLLGQTRPRRLGWARIRLAQAKNGQGGIISPPTPACRTLFVLHAEQEKKKINARMRGKKNYLARRRLCVAGGAAAE